MPSHYPFGSIYKEDSGTATEALQTNNDHQSFDRDLEGAGPSAPVPRRRARRCWLCFAGTKRGSIY